MIGKFAVSAGFELIYFWSAEMYPTSLRNSMLGVNSASARVAGMIAPVIADIVSYLKHCPVNYYQICAPFGKNYSNCSICYISCNEIVCNFPTMLCWCALVILDPMQRIIGLSNLTCLMDLNIY